MSEDEDVTVNRDLPVKLTTEDLERLGTEMSVVELEIKDLKDQVSGLNTTRRGKEGHRLELATTIDTGEETRSVECKWVESVAENVTRLIRQDTGEEVDSRTLTPDDLQQGLGIGGDPDNKQGEDGDDDEPTDTPTAA